MQKVAWPMMIVHIDSVMLPKAKNELSAMPVTMPGSARGSTRRNDTTSRPKKRNRCTAKAAADPSRSATPVAASPTFVDSHSAVRTSESCQATANHLTE